MDPMPSRMSPKLLIKVGIGFLVLIIVVLLIVSNSRRSTPPDALTGATPYISVTPGPGTGSGRSVEETKRTVPISGAIAKVGDEYIYESDLNYELAHYPTSNSGEAQEILMAKLIEDSIILQGAAKDGLVKVDNTIFNSSDKDYVKRVTTINELRDTIDAKDVTMEGTVIAIWFHNALPGAAGYDKGKQIAFDTLSKLLADIKSGKMTIKQAGEAIKNNTNLAQVDSSYKANATFDFSVSGTGQKITYSPELDEQIYRLNKNDISNILIGKDLDPTTGKDIDAVYMVAQVTERKAGGAGNFDTWLVNKTKEYETTRY